MQAEVITPELDMDDLSGCSISIGQDDEEARDRLSESLANRQVSRMAYVAAAFVIAAGLVARDSMIFCAGTVLMMVSCAMPVLRDRDFRDTFDGTL